MLVAYNPFIYYIYLHEHITFIFLYWYFLKQDYFGKEHQTRKKMYWIQHFSQILWKCETKERNRQVRFFTYFLIINWKMQYQKISLSWLYSYGKIVRKRSTIKCKESMKIKYWMFDSIVEHYNKKCLRFFLLTFL